MVEREVLVRMTGTLKGEIKENGKSAAIVGE